MKITHPTPRRKDKEKRNWDAIDPRKDTTILVAGREANGFDTTVAGFTQRVLKQACENMGIPSSMMNEMPMTEISNDLKACLLVAADAAKDADREDLRLALLKMAEPVDSDRSVAEVIKSIASWLEEAGGLWRDVARFIEHQRLIVFEGQRRNSGRTDEILLQAIELAASNIRVNVFFGNAEIARIELAKVFHRLGGETVRRRGNDFLSFQNGRGSIKAFSIEHHDHRRATNAQVELYDHTAVTWLMLRQRRREHGLDFDGGIVRRGDHFLDATYASQAALVILDDPETDENAQENLVEYVRRFRGTVNQPLEGDDQ